MAAGHQGNSRPIRFGPWPVVYVNDDQGFSVELLHVGRSFQRWMGFEPRRTPRLAPFLGRADRFAPASRRRADE